MINKRVQLAKRVKEKKINKTQTWTRNLTIYRKDSWYTPYIKLGGNEDDAVSLKSFCLFIKR